MSAFVPPAGVSRDREQAQIPQVVGFLNQLADAALVAAMFVVPSLLGGVRPSAQLLLGVLAACAATAWLLAQLLSRDSRWSWLGVEPLIVLGIALLVLQVTPLPREWRDRLSPELSTLLPSAAENDAVGPSEWRTLSVTPDATRRSLHNLAAYALLFLVAAQRVRAITDAQRMLRWVACAAVGMAAFGLVHFVFSNGQFFWYLSVGNVDASAVVHGSFVNRNHLAQFLALGVGPLLMLAVTGESSPGTPIGRSAMRGARPVSGRRGAVRRFAAWLGLAGVLAAMALSQSRGGMIAAGASIIVCLAMCRRSRLLDEKVLIGAFVLGAALVAALFLPGAQRLEPRLVEDIASLDLDRIDGDSARRRIWDAVASGIAEFPIIGAGAGSQRYVYPLYYDQLDDGTEYTTAESGYLQIGLEAGGAGLALLLAGIAVGLFRCVRSARAARVPEQTACLAAVLGSIAATTVHAIVETHWFMPGCMALLAPLAGCGFGLSNVAASGPIRLWRIPRITWAGGIAGLAWCATTALPVHVRAMQDSASWTIIETLAADNTGSEAPRPALAGRDLAAASDLAITEPRLHLELAKLHLQAFEARQREAENPMSLSDLRQATVNASFESSDERREWLKRATAGNIELLFRAQAHVRRCLETCPLEGRAYLYAADLCFLDGGDAARQQELVALARRLRPFNAQVDFAAGQLAWQSGDVAAALDHWKRAYDRSRNWQKTIARLLITHMPAAEFLKTFEPDWQTLRDLQHQMSESGHPEYPVVARRFADASVARAHEVTDGSEELLLREALKVYRRLGEQDAIAECALLAVRYAPGSYDAHAAAGRALHALGRDAEALEQLRWCLQRKPNDAPLSELFRSVLDRAGEEATISLTNFAVDADPGTTIAQDDGAVDDSHSGVEHSDSSFSDEGQHDARSTVNVGPITEGNR